MQRQSFIHQTRHRIHIRVLAATADTLLLSWHHKSFVGDAHKMPECAQEWLLADVSKGSLSL